MATKRENEDNGAGGASKKVDRKLVRVWCDGCYDMMHFGHANSLRQAKEMGDYLIVGVHSDADITKHKGPPVMSEADRYAMVRSCKWVDEVVEAAPYVTTLETLDKYNCDFCVHGDDITTTADGHDTYQEVKDQGRYRECKRTAGVSTTDLVGRMLLMTKEHFRDESEPLAADGRKVHEFARDRKSISSYTGVSTFLTTTRKIGLFAEGREPKPNDRVVYVSGSFDLFHVGHVEILRQAKEQGDFVIAAIHTDKGVNSYKGSNHPIMNLHERTLMVLACRYVDEAVIGAPVVIDEETLKHFNVNVVMHGSTKELGDIKGLPDPYALAKEKGMYKEIEVPADKGHTADTIVERILKHREEFQKRNKKKEEKEAAIIAAEALRNAKST